MPAFADFMNYLTEVTDVKDKNVTVMGLGLFGGGVAAARFLAEHGAKVTVTDLKSEKSLAPAMEKLADLALTFHLGGHVEEDFTGADMILVSPAVPKTSRFLKLAADAGVPFETEMNLFFKLCRGTIIGVTGSNGKSTVAAFLHDIIIRKHPDALLGGNIGKSLLLEAENVSPGRLVVLELSSFQLEDLGRIRQSPAHAVVTNITSNHLDRHGTFKAYLDAKKNIFRFRQGGGVTILNADDEECAACAGKVPEGPLGGEVPGRVVWFSRKRPVEKGAFLRDGKLVLADGGEICARSDVLLPGDFNIENVLAAAAMAKALGMEKEHIRETAASFPGVPHRLEFLGTFGGVRVYNDSIATNPESTIGAIRTVEGPKVLLAGGSDKDLDFSALAREVKGLGVKVVTLGATGPKIASALRSAGADVSAEVDTLAEAVRTGFEIAGPGWALLLSPASASFDQFENFEHRGRAFRELVKRYEK